MVGGQVQTSKRNRQGLTFDSLFVCLSGCLQQALSDFGVVKVALALVILDALIHWRKRRSNLTIRLSNSYVTLFFSVVAALKRKC